MFFRIRVMSFLFLLQNISVKKYGSLLLHVKNLNRSTDHYNSSTNGILQQIRKYLVVGADTDED